MGQVLVLAQTKRSPVFWFPFNSKGVAVYEDLSHYISDKLSVFGLTFSDFEHVSYDLLHLIEGPVHFSLCINPY
jgi:hypothetical protein